MGLFNNLKHLFQFGYQAAESTPKRKTPVSSLRNEDDELGQHKRGLLISTTRDLIRNCSAAKWLVDTHLDKVATCEFQSKSGDKNFDAQFERLMTWWGEPNNCDVSGRHGFHDFIRLIELSKVVDGDVFLLKLNDGRLQAIEADRCRFPYNIADIPLPEGSTLINGLCLDAAGKLLGIVVCKRQALGQIGMVQSAGSGGFEFERYIDAQNIIHYGHFPRFDCYRGVSELSTSINTFIDIASASELALVKAKLINAFGIKFTRESSEALPGEAADDGSYNVDMGAGPFALDLKPGDDAQLMESAGTPSTEFQAFVNLSLQQAFKSLSVPFSYFNESFSTYSGSRQASILYSKSVDVRRRRLKTKVLDEITWWKLNTWIAAGMIKLPSGMTAQQINWDFVGVRFGSVDPMKELQAKQLAVELGVESRTDICKEDGRDFETVIGQIAKENKLMADAGIPLSSTRPFQPPMPVEVTNNG